jgi:dipeptidyl aminopeptidase/acylaminoacyl peptidase
MSKTLISTRSIIAATLILATSFCAPAVSAQPRGPMGPADILRVATVSDAQISPNGRWVVYTVSTFEGNETVSTLWLVRVTDSSGGLPTNLPSASQRGASEWPPIRNEAATPLLARGWNASNPRWSPDSSKIAFLSNHDDQQGLWVVNLEKRDARFVVPVMNTNFFITYEDEPFAWAPDSKRIAYVSATEEVIEKDETSDNSQPDDPRVIDRIQYKSRTAFSDNRRTHVWITTIDRPEPRQLTSGAFYDHALTFNPDGDEIAFISNREPDPDANNNSDIFAVDLHGETRQITQTKGCEYGPTWSPDGKWIAYTATRRDVTTIDSVAEDTHLWVTEASGGSRTELTAALDRRVRNPRWSSDSKWLFFLAGDSGLTRLHRVERARESSVGSDPGFPSTHVTLVTNEAGNSVPIPLPTYFQITSFSLSSSATPLVTFSLSDSRHPAELWAAMFGQGQTMRRLTGHNDRLVQSNEFIVPESLSCKSFDGTRIQGWLMKPAGWRADRKYPLILSIHGGPHGMSGWAFSPTFQVYAARGYAVLYLNPRGSSGYGQQFSDGTLNEWGGGDYKDLMAGVDEALRKYTWIDGDRMGVTGGSYGGFMTNWIITQTPRFKAAVANASVSNLISFYSSSLYQDLIHAEFGGFPWDNYDLLWQWSPLKYVKQAQTPTLFIHGEQDNDVHITQAEEMYTALKRRGVETVLVRYPREGHGLREPKHKVDALERTLRWFDRYLK